MTDSITPIASREPLLSLNQLDVGIPAFIAQEEARLQADYPNLFARLEEMRPSCKEKEYALLLVMVSLLKDAEDGNFKANWPSLAANMEKNRASITSGQYAIFVTASSRLLPNPADVVFVKGLVSVIYANT